MQLKELKLKNWMIFGGDQEIDFAVGSANITLIFGENMHGKTTLLNSIRWVMYGKALNRQGKQIPNLELINKVAYQNGDTEMGVELTFEVDGVESIISRSIQFADLNNDIQNSLRVGGRMVDGGKINATIERLLPEQISQFMLFDGELLKEFESLVVAEGSAQANGIRNAIEDTLGIPVLSKTEDVIDKVVRDLGKARNEELQKDAQFKLLASRLQELETHKENVVGQREEAKRNLVNYKAESVDLRAKLDETQEALRLIERKKLCENTAVSIQEKISEDKVELRQIAKDLWVVPLKQTVAPIIEELNKRLDELNHMRELATSKNMQAIRIRRSLDQLSCPTCGSSISEGQLDTMKAELEKIEEELAQNSDTDELIWETTSQIKKLSFANEFEDRRREYSVIQNSLKKAELDLLDTENEIYDIGQQLKGVDEQTSLLERRKYDSIIGQIAVIEDTINKFDGQFVDLDKDIKQIRKSPEFARVSEGSDIVSKAERAAQLKELFETAISLYRDEMRHKVEDRASVTFSALTTEKTFDKLEINESYGLRLIVDGQTVNRSAGAEQIVAISLIEALNSNGRRKGPMIMDTPVGRLDRTHRANILRHLPTVVTQLGIFAHSGELEEEDPSIDVNLVGRRYRIERRSTFHSELVRL